MWKVLGVIGIFVIAGCLAPAPDSTFDEPTDPIPPENPPSATIDPFIEITPSHGSALANITATTPWILEAANQTWQGNQTTQILIPFLKPNTQYAINFQSGSTQIEESFTTTTSPWQWNTNDDAIRPGQRLDMNPGECTMAFLYRDATNESMYALTAGHCMDKVGDLVTTSDPVDDELVIRFEQQLGVVWYASQLDNEAAKHWDWVPDYGLIRISNGTRASLNPQMVQWGGPTGPWQAGDDAVGEVVCGYGHGNVIGWTFATRPRCGEIEGRNSQGSIMTGFTALSGDSGGPVIHERGRALGIMTGTLGAFVAIADLCSIHEAMELAGLDLELVTAPLTGVPASVTTPSLGLYDQIECLTQ
jgi:hypothetical protein